MVEIGYFALFLLVVAAIAAGVVAGVVHTWTLRASLYDLQSRLEVVEGNLLREVKARAGQERWKKTDKDAELIKNLAAPPIQSTVRYNWWERVGKGT